MNEQYSFDKVSSAYDDLILFQVHYVHSAVELIYERTSRFVLLFIGGHFFSDNGQHVALPEVL